MTDLLIEVGGLEKRYGARMALDGVALDLRAGEILGLVGPNGSGKTTLLRILAGLQRPSAGRVRVLALEPWRERARIMQHVRFAFAPPALFESLTAREHLTHLAGLGVRGPIGPSDVEDTLGIVGLGERADERVQAFSFGMRQRLSLAQALLPRPRLLVLDEPTEGLDPLAIIELRGVLARLRSEHGIAVLLSSHLLIEIDQLVDRMVVLSEGRVLFAGVPEELRRGGERLVLTVAEPEKARERLAERALEALPAGEGELELPAQALTLEQATALLGPGQLLGFHVRRRTLEAALLARLAEGGAP